MSDKLPSKTNAEGLAALPEAARGYYSERDGSYFLGIEASDGYGLHNVTELNASLASARSDAQTAKEALARFGDLDPQAARDALAKLKELESQPPADTQNDTALFDAKVKELTTNFEKQLAEKTSEYEASSRAMHDHVKQAAAATASAELNANPTLLAPHVLRELKVVQEGGQVHVRVVDPTTGHERLTTDTARPGQPMTPRELVEEMSKRDDLKEAFRAQQRQGLESTSQPSRGGNPPHTISADQAKNPAAYRAAKAAAQKAGAQLTIV